jgi:hypothetical protein
MSEQPKTYSEEALILMANRQKRPLIKRLLHKLAPTPAASTPAPKPPKPKPAAKPKQTKPAPPPQTEAPDDHSFLREDTFARIEDAADATFEPSVVLIDEEADRLS